VVLKKKAMKSSGIVGKAKGDFLLWGILILICKVLGIAFLVQGFVRQLASGLLYSGLFHYAVGAILGILAWHLHKKKCQSCK